MKFFYCKPSDTGLLYRPYELRVVDKRQVCSPGVSCASPHRVG